MKINVGMVGATGLVGEVFLQILQQRNFPVGELRLFASESSLGKKLRFNDRDVTLQVLKPGCFNGLDLVFFSSGDDISRDWAPQAVASGAFAVDNSGAFRMNSEIALLVPEVNGHLLPPRSKPALIANPNCSTIQLVLALHPLAQRFGLESVKVASYQSVSGAGREALQELKEHSVQCLAGTAPTQAQYQPRVLAFNSIPQIGSFSDNGFCSEEIKIMRESKKILGRDDFTISAFTVRVPALVGHAEAVWVRLREKVSTNDVVSTLQKAPGLQVCLDDYPTVQDCAGKDATLVGRIRRDLEDEQTFLLWIVSDNLRKGAALNGVQIAEAIFDT